MAYFPTREAAINAACLFGDNHVEVAGIDHGVSQLSFWKRAKNYANAGTQQSSADRKAHPQKRQIAQPRPVSRTQPLPANELPPSGAIAVWSGFCHSPLGRVFHVGWFYSFNAAFALPRGPF
jgi:hypothetical protein